MVRRSAKEKKELLEKRLSEVSARWTDPAAAVRVAEAPAEPVPSVMASSPVDAPNVEVLDNDSDSSSDEGSTMGIKTEFVEQLPTIVRRPTHIEVPDISYFEIRRDKEKRAYVESFADIVGRVKTNYQFRCKGCGETLIGQYLNMLVHMSGKHNHLTVRARACTNPFPDMKAKILQDYADYNAKQQFVLSQIKQEPGSFLDPIAPVSTKGTRGKKRKHVEAYEAPRTAQYISALVSALPGAAVFENSIGSRPNLATSVTLAEVTDYYSKVLTKSTDLKTSCCTTGGAPPEFLRRALGRVHPDVKAKYYGCGFIAPELLHGQRVLDLGCGAGRDCYVLAQLVGERGQVVGVDMSADQLATARATIEWHREKFGYVQSNTAFAQNYLEKLLSRPVGVPRVPVPSASRSVSASSIPPAAVTAAAASHGNSSALAVDPSDDSDSEEETPDPAMRAVAAAARALLEGAPDAANADAELKEGSFDVIVSNCVVNLSPDKAAVLNNAYRLLKTGGEFYFSDVYCSQRVPDALRKDPVLWAECLSGALYWNDFLRLAKLCGFADPRLVTSAPVNIGNAQLEEAIAQHMPPTLDARGKALPQFYSATYRLWKIAELEPDCEDYGQAVQYLGTIPYPDCQEPSPKVAVRALPLEMSAASPSAHEKLMRSFDLALDENDDFSAHSGAGSAGASDPADAPPASSSSAVKLMPSYKLDDHHVFPAGKVMPVCGNTFRMLHQTRLKGHFRFFGGNFTQHYGIFNGCGKSMPFSADSSCSSGSCC